MATVINGANPRPSSSPSRDYDGFEVDFTTEEEELLVALLDQYNAQRQDIDAGAITAGRDGRGGGDEIEGLAVREHGPDDALVAKPSQQSDSSFVSTISFASSTALLELLESSVFPAAVQLSVPNKKPSTSALKSTPPSATDGTAKVLEEAAALSVRDKLGADNVANVPAGAAEDPRDVSSPPPTTLPPSRTRDASTASPLAQWRAHKALSVTDLISPSWCELQYSLSLTHHGRKRRTPAMKQGSVAHQKLEDEVHATFEVAVMSKEDAWALRLWNVIQGARTLREAGLTRELEVWGLVHGQLVIGIIDQLSYECSDEDLERQAATEQNEEEAGQQKLEDYFKSLRSGALSRGNRSKEHGRKTYITDIKTRTVRSLPRGSSFRPTAMQLMLYHTLLNDLVAGRFDPQRLWDRYNVDPDAKFTDAFIAQFLEDEFLDSAPSSQDWQEHDAQRRFSMPIDNGSLPSTAYTDESSMHDVNSSLGDSQETQPTPLTRSFEDLYSMLRWHNSLRRLWDLMIAELTAAMPVGLGTVLTAEYRAQDDSSEVLGNKSLLFDQKVLDEYLTKTMQWWKGERHARGVEIDEAWKCGSCEFADSCEWRKTKVQEAIRMFRDKNKRQPRKI